MINYSSTYLDGVDCPEEQNTVDEYLPEYMRCLTKRKKRAAVTEDDPSCEDYCLAGHCSVICERDGKSLQWIIDLLPRGIVNAIGLGGDDSDDDNDGSDDDSDMSDDDSDGSDDDSDGSDDEGSEEEEEDDEGEDEEDEGEDEDGGE